MEDKIFFVPGEVVTIKQDILNKPLMVVKSIDKVTIRSKTTEHQSPRATLFGITCFWFSTQGVMQESRFNTKDLMHV